jgi:nucleotide-binding universal stress UspA family protein
MSIDRILVPLDGTPFAERALPIAARLARLTHGALVLARVEEPQIPAMSGLGDVAVPIPGVDEVMREADAVYLDGVVARLRAAGTDARPLVLDGDLGHALREACAREGIGLVVMASHARGRIGRLLLGSGAERVLHGGPRVPVLVVRGSGEDVVEREIARIVVALDTEDDAEATVDAAVEIARPTGAALTLLMPHDRDRDRKATLLPTAVLAPAEREGDVTLPDDVPDDRAFLTRVAHALAAEGVPVDVRMVEGDDIADAVARTVRELRADVVAVGARAGHGLADALRHAVDTPVLVVPPRDR